jgi:cobalamin biosynthesis Mg chelatase CobN
MTAIHHRGRKNKRKRRKGKCLRLILGLKDVDSWLRRCYCHLNPSKPSHYLSLSLHLLFPIPQEMEAVTPTQTTMAKTATTTAKAATTTKTTMTATTKTATTMMATATATTATTTTETATTATATKTTATKTTTTTTTIRRSSASVDDGTRTVVSPLLVP